MLRITFLVFAFAIISLVAPVVHDQGTEMGFTVGSPDPNVYKTTYLFGWPLAWIAWERSWNEAAGYDESAFGSFHVVNFVMHVLLIVTSLLLYLRLLRQTQRARPSGLDDPFSPG